MTDFPRRNLRSSLADLHSEALDEPAEAGVQGASRFAAWLDAAEPSEEPTLQERGAEAVVPIGDRLPWWRASAGRGLMVAASIAACAFAVGHAVRQPSETSTSRPEPPFSRGAPIAPADSIGWLGADDPCRSAVHAAGGAPLVDDFEDGDELVALRESRNGYWVLVTDTDPGASESVLLPSPRPSPLAENRKAIHLAGDRRTKWGASVQLELGPPCYDASAYRGIGFDVLGPGRVYAGVREVDATPVDRGGVCTQDCYQSHLHPVDASRSWVHHQIIWADLYQRDRANPANPRRLNGLEFLVRPEDTPYDVWIDNVTFVR